MATDKLIYEYTTHFPNAVAKFIHAEADDYEAKSITFKQTEKRADLFLIGRSGHNVILIEPHGYGREDFFYDMLQKILFYCTHNKYWGRMDAAAIFLEETHYRAARRIVEQFDDPAFLHFAPKIFVLNRIKERELTELHDIRMTPLYPLCDIAPQEITRKAPLWAQQVKSATDLTEHERKNLLSYLGGAISHRVKGVSQADLNKLFGGFVMEDTPVGQEILQIGIGRGIPQGIHLVLFKQLAARFGTVPEELRQKLQAIDDVENLERIATLLLTIQSMDELKDLVN